MRVEYYPDTDSLFIKLKDGIEAEGVEVAPGIVFHYTPEGEVTAIDIDSQASKLVDVSSLKAEGLALVGEAAERIRREERERMIAEMERRTVWPRSMFEGVVEDLRAEDREEHRF